MPQAITNAQTSVACSFVARADIVGSSARACHHC
jgi:hypothetical protein